MIFQNFKRKRLTTGYLILVNEYRQQLGSKNGFDDFFEGNLRYVLLC